MIDRFDGQWAFLNNFFLHLIVYQDIRYPSLEHGFAASKTEDRKMRLRIAAAATPAIAKRLGRVAVLRPGWDSHLRYTTMWDLLGLKFATDSSLARPLLITGEHVLVEGNNWHDQVWGDCRCGRAACEPAGMNLLGWMLMMRRAQLMTEVVQLTKLVY